MVKEEMECQREGRWEGRREGETNKKTERNRDQKDIKNEGDKKENKFEVGHKYIRIKDDDTEQGGRNTKMKSKPSEREEQK